MCKTTTISPELLAMLNYYQNDDRPFAVAWSGGKDSTATLILVFEMLKMISNPSKKVYIMFSDTMLEMDPVVFQIKNTIKAIKQYIIDNNLPVEFIQVEPELKHTFFSLLIGKGYTLPRRDYRWCTNRLKILPQDKAIKGILEKETAYISVTGVRKDEGHERADRIDNNTIDGIYKTHDTPGCNMLTPIQDWTQEDVWNTIYSTKQAWVDSVGLGVVYSYAAGDGDECRTMLEGNEGENAGCSGSARFGCWICPLFKKDKTLNNLTSHYSYMTKMEEFRNWLVQYRDGHWDKRDVYNHRSHTQKIYDNDNHRKGMTLPGGYTLEFRQEILKELLLLEKSIIKDRGEPLITDKELTYIQEIWVEEGDYELTVFKLAEHRNFEISKKHHEIVESILIYKKAFYKESNPNEISWHPPYWDIPIGLNENANQRYFAQLFLQLQKIEKDPFEFARILTSTYKGKMSDKLWYEKYKEIRDVINELPVETKQYYPSDEEMRYTQKEWKDDETGFWTFMELQESGEITANPPEKTLFGFNGENAKHYEVMEELDEVFDVTLCTKMSLADQMKYFES